MLGHHDFGQQNTEAEGHEQMDYALEKGVNFGTAEMYLFLLEETYGDTERIIGTWFKKTGRREEVVLNKKGPNPNS
jgi:aryl-alcohol dehydrogenase-like predicted oxidoreductase